MTLESTAVPPAETRLSVAAGSLELVIRPDPAGGFEIRLRLHGSDAPAAVPEPLPGNGFVPLPEPPAASVEAGEAGAAEPAPAGAVEVRAPLVGVFYRRPGPGEPPFVEVGSQVEAGSTLAIVEAMKLMNQIPAPVSGRVIAITAEDQDVVEYDEVLVSIAPGGGPVSIAPGGGPTSIAPGGGPA